VLRSSAQNNCKFSERNRAVVKLVVLAGLLLPNTSVSEAAGGNVPYLVVTFGTSLSKKGGWQQALEKQLSACMDQQVDVQIVAKVGANSDWGLSTVNDVIVQHARVVTVEFAVNDSDLWGGISREQSRRNVRLIVAALRASDPQVRILLMSMNPIFGWHFWLRPELGNYYADLAAIAAEQHVEWIDLESRWLALPEAELAQGIPDGVHPREELAREVIVPSLAKAIGGIDCAK
jgi:acyl-CoA thioesterase I